MREATHRTWEIVINIITSLLTVVGILIGVEQFNKQQKENAELEFRREMWKIKSENYSQVCEAAGIISSRYSSDSAFINAKEKFERLYWGSLVINSDEGVNTALLDFHTTLQYATRNDSSLFIRLATQASNLVDSCNKSLVAHWQDINQ